MALVWKVGRAIGEDPRRWVVRLLKGLYGIKQGPRIWALKLHSVLTDIGFERTDCDHPVYVYQRGGVRIILPIHVIDLPLWLLKPVPTHGENPATYLVMSVMSTGATSSTCT